jgi:hypothetical protein
LLATCASISALQSTLVVVLVPEVVAVLAAVVLAELVVAEVVALLTDVIA